MLEHPQTTVAADRIGRYARDELAAMRGRRGRKPPEFYQLFPELRTEPKPVKPKASSPATVVADGRIGGDALAMRVAQAGPEVRQIITAILNLAATAGVVPARSAEPMQVVEVMRPGDGVTTEVVSSGPGSLVIRDPVYADPEDEPVVEDDVLVGLSAAG